MDEELNEDIQAEEEIVAITAQETASQTAKGYIDDLYSLLYTQDLLDAHGHTTAHRILDVIATIQELHRDIENPEASTQPPPFPDVLNSILKNFKKGQ